MSILVTGASRGIGLNIVRTFLQTQPTKKVIAACRNPSGADALIKLKQEHSDRLTIETLDVKEEESIKELVKKLHESHTTLSVLINNAGIYSGMEKETLLNSTKHSMLTVYETNVVAPMLLIQHLYNEKCFEQNGLIATISSVMGSIGT